MKRTHCQQIFPFVFDTFFVFIKSPRQNISMLF